MKTDTTTHKTNGRKTANAALITLFRACVIASMMMMLGAGMAAAAAFDDPGAGGESASIQSTPLGVVSSASSYDRQAAYDYAIQWWDSCNHDCSGDHDDCTPYSYWGSECCGYPSHGGDCANFVSQCIIAGGHPYLNTGDPCRGYPCGKEEIGAKKLGNCLVSKGWERTCGYHASPPSNIDVGDVLIYHKSYCDDAIAHATIVTYVSGSDVRITCHSVNRTNEPYTYMSTSHPYYEWLHYPSMVPIDIILDTDRSGSMSGQKIIDAKNAATLFVDLLEIQDQVGLVSFSSSATLDSHLTSDFEHAKSVIAGYSAGGSTNMGDALSKSIQELKTNGRDDTIWSIIYFTDGQTNAGLTKTEILDTLVPEAVDSGIIIYTLGYGSNVDEDFLRQVAEATGGKYYFAPDSAKLMEIYVELSQKIKGMEKIAEFAGTVSQGETKTETFLLESKTSFMRTFLIWPGSDLDLTVIDPSGNQIVPGPGVIYSGNDALPEYYEIYDPQTGEWTIEVYGKDVTDTTEEYTVMVFQPGALMQVKPTKWDVDYPLNRTMTFNVSEIAGNVNLTNVTFTASDLTETIVTSAVTSLMNSQAEAEERGEVAMATLTKDVYAQNTNVIPANCFSFTPNDFSVPAGGSKNVEATLTLPSNSIPSGTYSGTINVSSDSGNSTIFVTVIVTSVGTATGTGTAYFASDAGTIEDLAAIDVSTLPNAPHVDFPHGIFSFNITGLSNGETVNVTINFPQDIPTTAQYWKYNASSGEWYQIPIGSNDGDNIIIITLQDGGIGDNDGVENGIISDPGAPGVPSAPTDVPALAPAGIIALVGLLCVIGMSRIRRRFG